MRILVSVAFFLLFHVSLYCQQARRILLKEQLSVMEKNFNITFSYDADAVRDLMVPSPISADLAGILQALDSTTAFHFTQVDAQTVLVSRRQAGRNMLLTGRVTAGGGEALPGAIVGIKSQDAFTVTGISGGFKLLVNYVPSDSLAISFIGYSSKKIRLSALNNSAAPPLELEEASVELGGVVISGYMTSGINYIEDQQSIVLKPDKLGLLPAETETDIFSSLQALPGINSPDDRSGSLTLRGCDPDKVLISFDNIPIYHKGHYFGTFSPFNAQVIDEITVQRNGIAGADIGGRVGGYIGMRTKDDVPDSGAYSAGLATSYAYVSAFVPLVKNKLSLLLGARSSYPFNWNSPKIAAINELVFQESEVGAALNGSPGQHLNSFTYAFNDLNAKVIYVLNDKHKASLSFLHIKDKLTLEVLTNRGLLRSYDTASLNNEGLNLSVQNKWSARWVTNTDVTASYYLQALSGLSGNNSTLFEGERYHNTTKDLKLRTATTFYMRHRQGLMLGYEADLVSLSAIHSYFKLPNPAVVTGRPGNEVIHSVFTNYHLSGSDKLINVSAGLRLNYFTGTKAFYPEPRILLNVLLSKQLVLKASAGQYCQFINHIPGRHMSTLGGIDNYNWNLSNNSDIPVVSGKQLMAGGIYSRSGFVLDVEGYVKQVSDLTSYNFLSSRNDTGFVHGGYTSSGVDVLVKKSVKRFEGWISYSYSNSLARFDSLAFEYLWNQPHLLKAVLGYTYKNFRISMGFKYRSGLPALPGLRNRYLVGRLYTPAYVPNPGPPPGPSVYVPGSVARYNDRFPDSHQLDISASYKIVPRSKKIAVNIGATVQNVYNNKAIVGQIDRPLGNNTFMRVNKYGMGFMPSLIVGVSW